ncbi:MAG: ATP-dependent Clp protease ATP-binding subunit [Ruminococcaceae bacterium]|nr:ATP-dependent Clp protease ATP-binding subunit [Oscillospiraceae bacterium]
MKLCNICKKRPAVVFVSKMDGSQTINEGYCLSCAIKTGITPVQQLAEQFSIDPEELQSMVDEFSEMVESGEFPEGMMDMMGMMPVGMMPGGNLMEMGSEEDGEPTGEERIPLKDKNAKKSIQNEKKKKKCLNHFAVNLTEKAKNDLLDKVIGREREIDRAIQILNRRTKNNPVLLGLPGVGKTAIAEGIAQRIASGDVPEKLVGAQVYLLDLASVVAGTQYRGQFEGRLKGIVEEAKTDNTILVIDEIHSIVSAGDADGAMNAANILKPALSKGEIQVIGATTLDEYRKYVEKDAALERRFQSVIIDEPSFEDAVRILQGTKEYYELYHNLTIDDSLIREVVSLSSKYITDRYLPDKAIDVIDEAASKVNIKNPYSKQIIASTTELNAVCAQLEQLEQQTEDIPYEEIARLKSDKCRLEGEITGLRAKQRQTPLTLEDVGQVIELWTGIPVKNITETDREKLLHLEERLHRRVVGQDAAVSAVARAVRRNRALKLSKKRPVSFIFVGPTGVGKTELVKSLAECLFDDERALVRLDMSEYMEKHAVSKIIGAPPGYVGYDEAGQLTEKIRRKPYSVVLLDEIEKAHEDVFNLLLQILDDGRITDSQGRVVNFENTIIIMTSNAGTSVGANTLGFGGEGNKLSNRIEKTLKELFRPEFLNRVDEVIEFKELSHDQLLQIVDLMLGDLKKDLSHMGLGFVITHDAKAKILDNSYNPRYGARPIRREIQTSVEDAVATLLLSGDVADGSTITVGLDDAGAITVTV